MSEADLIERKLRSRAWTPPPAPGGLGASEGSAGRESGIPGRSPSPCAQRVLPGANEQWTGPGLTDRLPVRTEPALLPDT